MNKKRDAICRVFICIIGDAAHAVTEGRENWPVEPSEYAFGREVRHE